MSAIRHSLQSVNQQIANQTAPRLMAWTLREKVEANSINSRYF